MKSAKPLLTLGLLFSVAAFAAEPETTATNPSNDVVAKSEAPNQDAAAKFEEARALLPKGTRKGDPEMSYALMKEAADAGHADAIGALGHYLANGIGTPKDEGQAVEWFRRGAGLGSPKAMLNYGLVLSQGKGVEADQAAGREWIRKAAATGLPEANLEWAEALSHGNHGVTVDKAAAFPFYKIAADSGHPGACNSLGILYENGVGVEANAAVATDLFHKAALSGHTLGQMNYGRMLDPESADAEKRVEALAWLLLAEEKGSVQAAKLLDPIRLSGSTGFGDAQKKAMKLRMEILRSRSNR